MPEYAPTPPTDIENTPGALSPSYAPEAPADRAARLALDLGRARRRIAELEAAESRVRALAEQHCRIAALWTDPDVPVPSVALAKDIIAALHGPTDDQQDRKVST